MNAEWDHEMFFFVYFEHFFLNLLQTGKMSPKRVQGERWLSITGTNMSKLQLEIRNKQHQQKMTEKWPFLNKSWTWKSTCHTLIGFLLCIFLSDSVNITHSQLTTEMFTTCLQRNRIWTLKHLHCANLYTSIRRKFIFFGGGGAETYINTSQTVSYSTLRQMRIWSKITQAVIHPFTGRKQEVVWF